MLWLSLKLLPLSQPSQAPASSATPVPAAGPDPCQRWELPGRPAVKPSTFLSRFAFCRIGDLAVGELVQPPPGHAEQAQ